MLIVFSIFANVSRASTELGLTASVSVNWMNKFIEVTNQIAKTDSIAVRANLAICGRV